MNPYLTSKSQANPFVALLPAPLKNLITTPSSLSREIKNSLLTLLPSPPFVPSFSSSSYPRPTSQAYLPVDNFQAFTVLVTSNRLSRSQKAHIIVDVYAPIHHEQISLIAGYRLASISVLSSHGLTPGREADKGGFGIGFWDLISC